METLSHFVFYFLLVIWVFFSSFYLFRYAIRSTLAGSVRILMSQTVGGTVGSAPFSWTLRAVSRCTPRCTSGKTTASSWGSKSSRQSKQTVESVPSRLSTAGSAGVRVNLTVKRLFGQVLAHVLRFYLCPNFTNPRQERCSKAQISPHIFTSGNI